VLVAFVIAALAGGALLSGVSDGLRVARVAAQTEPALSHARSHLAALGSGAAIVAGEQSGDDGGGFRWRTRVTQLVATQLGPDARGGGPPVGVTRPAAAAPPSRAVLYAVAVVVSWGEGRAHREVTLRSERMGLAGGPPP